MSKNKFILLIPYLVIGIIFSLFYVGRDSEYQDNYIWLVPIILIVVGFLPVFFPFLKKYKFGTLGFYPTILSKIYKRIKAAFIRKQPLFFYIIYLLTSFFCSVSFHFFVSSNSNLYTTVLSSTLICVIISDRFL